MRSRFNYDVDGLATVSVFAVIGILFLIASVFVQFNTF